MSPNGMIRQLVELSRRDAGETDHQIDTLVHQWFDLTEEEIRIVAEAK